MKRMICIIVLALMLCACAAEPAAATLPPQTTAPTEPSVPQTTAPAAFSGSAAPILADYAPESFNAYHAYWCEEMDYLTSIGFTPTERLTDVQFGLLDWFETESWQMAEVLYTIDALDPDHPFLAQVVFWGDMTTYGISFTDEAGNIRHYAVSISGKDGSLICQEYWP